MPKERKKDNVKRASIRQLRLSIQRLCVAAIITACKPSQLYNRREKCLSALFNRGDHFLSLVVDGDSFKRVLPPLPSQLLRARVSQCVQSCTPFLPIYPYTSFVRYPTRALRKSDFLHSLSIATLCVRIIFILYPFLPPSHRGGRKERESCAETANKTMQGKNKMRASEREWGKTFFFRKLVAISLSLFLSLSLSLSLSGCKRRPPACH